MRSGLSAVSGTNNVTLTPLEFENPLVTAQFALTIDNTIHQDGHYQLSDLLIKDLAGNEVTVSLNDVIIIDSTPDNLMIKQEQLSFIRSPFGNAAEESLSDSFSIPSGVAVF